MDRLIVIPGKGTPDGDSVATQIRALRRDDCEINIDVTGGFGGSPFDILKREFGVKVSGINFAGKSESKDKNGQYGFVNHRSAMYWCVRELLDPASPVKVALPPDSLLLYDLAAPHYDVIASGIRVEKKQDIEERLGRSVDRGDAAVLAMWARRKKKFWIK